MDIKGFKSSDGTVYQYDYESLANIPDSGETPGSGADGGYYTPVVTQPDEETLQFDFTPSKEDLPAVEAVRVKLPASDGANVDQVSVEPEEDDIPKIFYGDDIPQTKDDTVMSWRYISKTEDISAYCETKAQGNSSMSYAKKNQTTKLYADEACEEKLKVDFKGWGKQRKFCLKANWIDLSHARNIVSARLWADCIKSRADYESLPELLRTSPNQGIIDGFPVKVYANGVYQGRYTLNIPKDAWMANMDDSLDEHCILCGENYVSGCFRAAANINESDWTDEVHDTVPDSIKTRWNEVISFVMNSTDEEFKAGLSDSFYVDSLIDYYLFGLASCGLDAFGKNQLYMTYDGQKWIAQMYDMDSTWGLYYNGQKFVATDYGRNQYEDYVNSTGNLLYVRLEQLFWSELQTRWAELKNGALSIENIINRFERFTDIAPAELVKEDYASTTGGGKFTGIPSQTTNNIQQIRAYALARQVWTDKYVEGLTPEVEVPCTGISLDAETLTFTAEGSQTLTATVTPDGCTDTVTWESDNTSIATVSGGVVTAIANGSCNITAKCGEYSAVCSVAVSGIAEPVPCTGITLDKTELAFDGEGTQAITATFEPSGTTDTAVWVSSAPAVASIVVEGNVCTVQSKSNGNATITVTCGDQSASCSVGVSGIVADESLLYRLPQETILNGTSDYVDTGVQLLAEDSEFTVLVDFEYSGDGTDGNAIIHCMHEALPYPGFYVRRNNIDNTRLDLNIDTGNGIQLASMNTRNKMAIIYKGNGQYAGFALSDDYASAIVGSGTFTPIQETAVLGAYQDVSGNKGRFITGTFYDAQIYSRALTPEEVVTQFSLENRILDVVWSDNATYSIKADGTVTTDGADYVTELMAVPDDRNAVVICNNNDAEFTFLTGVWYDENQELISLSGDSSTTAPVSCSVPENAKFMRFKAYPNGADISPETGICVII